MPHVTRRQAESVLRAVIAQNKVYCEPLLAEDGTVLCEAGPLPTLVENFQSWYSTTRWAIVWEGGPDEWSLRVTEGGRTEEERVLLAQAQQEFGHPVNVSGGPQAAKIPAGVFVEPINSYALGIYPA